MNAPGSVLVVDDDADVRALVSELLTRAGYEVSEAPNGREALKALFDERPDLVVLDVTMPELDGWATLERIRDLSDVPVVMLSARGGELEKVRGLRAGADDYVTKPFGRQELLARVESVLRRAPAAAVRRRAIATGADGRLRRTREVRGGRPAGRADPARVPDARRLRRPSQPAARARPVARARVGRRSAASSRDQVKLYVGYLRRKLGWAGVGPPIETVRGYGYRYSPG